MSEERPWRQQDTVVSHILGDTTHVRNCHKTKAPRDQRVEGAGPRLQIFAFILSQEKTLSKERSDMVRFVF